MWDTPTSTQYLKHICIVLVCIDGVDNKVQCNGRTTRNGWQSLNIPTCLHWLFPNAQVVFSNCQREMLFDMISQPLGCMAHISSFTSELTLINNIADLWGGQNILVDWRKQTARGKNNLRLFNQVGVWYCMFDFFFKPSWWSSFPQHPDIDWTFGRTNLAIFGRI